MEAAKIGMREFRENLAGYLEGGRPLAITRHGQTLGFFIPAKKRSRKAEIEAMRAAAKEIDAMIAAWGASEDELKARIAASLPKEGEVRALTVMQREKLEAVAPVLKVHGREDDYLLKVVESRQARIAIYARSVVLITDTALRVLSATPLQGLVAHGLVRSMS